MEDKNIKGMSLFSGETDGEIDKGIKEKRIEWIKNSLNALKNDLTKLNDYRDRWTDFDVAVICWLLAHDPAELEFWKETELGR